MSPKIEINFPIELQTEIATYSKYEGLTINEFVLWAIGEKIGELRERKGVKNLSRLPQQPINASQPPKPENQAAAPQLQKGAKRLLKAEEVAKIINTSKSEAYRIMQTGELLTIRLGRMVRVREEDLEDYIMRFRK